MSFERGAVPAAPSKGRRFSHWVSAPNAGCTVDAEVLSRLAVLARTARTCAKERCDGSCLVNLCVDGLSASGAAVFLRPEESPDLTLGGCCGRGASSLPTTISFPGPVDARPRHEVERALREIERKLDVAEAGGAPVLAFLGEASTPLGVLAAWGIAPGSADAEALALLAGMGFLCADRQRLRREKADAVRHAETRHRLMTLGAMASVMAHEMKNSFVSMNTFLELLPQRLQDPDFTTRFYELTRNEFQRMTALVCELLDLARETPLVKLPCRLDEILADLHLLCSPQAKSRRVHLSVSSDPALPFVVLDRRRILQVLLNLVLNAIEASEPAGNVHVEAGRVPAAPAETPDHAVWIRVIDEGRGIDPAMSSRIFEPYVTTRPDGLGLGLSIARDIVRDHGGRIEVGPGPVKGSIFKVLLPVADQKHMDSSSGHRPDAD